MAQPFNLAGITYTVGAPSFAQFAKGGNLERMRNGICAEGTKVVPAASLPALAKNARTGHPLVWSLPGRARWAAVRAVSEPLTPRYLCQRPTGARSSTRRLLCAACLDDLINLPRCEGIRSLAPGILPDQVEHFRL